jgi:hypothetical protein
MLEFILIAIAIVAAPFVAAHLALRGLARWISAAW